MVKVSVVVPVYNPGPHIEPLLASLAAQTLPPEEVESVFVDDGSSDGTAAKLDRLAADHPNVRVIHQPNSGWPGQPRNVGIEAARGEYIFFSDNDDWLGPDALKRMHAMARATGADIVIGKMVGHNRGVPRVLFRKTVERATLADDPLIDSLTPHKLFRRSFLNQHSLRFPEGKRRLEDHVFVLRAYFCAQVISVLADYPCYHHIRREGSTNAGYSKIDPPSYYGYVRESLDIVDRHTEAGKLRDRLQRRFLRQELLGRLDAQLSGYEPDYLGLLFREIRMLVVERFPETVDAGLPARQRLLAGAVRAGRLNEVIRLVDWSAAVAVQPRLLDLRWDGEMLQISWEARLAAPAGALIVGEPAQLRLGPPPDLPGSKPVDVTAELRRVRADVVARHRHLGDDLLLPSTVDIDVDNGALLVTGTSHLAPERATSGGPLAAGIWDLSIRMTPFGWSAEVRLGKNRTPGAAAHRQPVFIGTPARTARLYWTVPHGNLSLELDGGAKPMEPILRAAGGTLRLDAARQAIVATLTLPIPAARSTSAHVRLQRSRGAGFVEVPVRLKPDGERTTLVTDPVPYGRSSQLPTGRYPLSLRRRDAAGGVPLGLELDVPRRGSPRIRPTADPSGHSAATAGGSWPVRGRRYAERLLSAAQRRARAIRRARTGR